MYFFFFQAEDGIRDIGVTGVQTCALPICYSVDTGEVAIVSRFGKINRIDTEGLNFKLPFVESKQFMETREKTYIFGKTEEADTTLEVSTKDMQSIRIDLTVQANIVDPERSEEHTSELQSRQYL